MTDYTGPCCAHLRVAYQTRREGKATVGWWACTDCQQKFVPTAAIESLQRDLAERDALRSRAEAAEKDAARYRFMRDDWDDSAILHMFASGSAHWDATIDAAIAAGGDDAKD